MSDCIHPYAKPLAVPGLYQCSVCGEMFSKQEKTVKHKVENWPMPGVHYAFNTGGVLWTNTQMKLAEQGSTGWMNIPLKIVLKYGWYISVIGMDDYLVMPVTRKKLNVFYSSRRLTNNGGPKYKYPPCGMDCKRVWTSSDVLGDPVALAEGVADAAYVSELLDSIALMGSFLSQEVFDLVKGRTVLVMMDGDMKGIGATTKILQELKGAKIVIPVFMPEEKDPTDLSYTKILREIKFQAGIRL